MASINEMIDDMEECIADNINDLRQELKRLEKPVSPGATDIYTVGYQYGVAHASTQINDLLSIRYVSTNAASYLEVTKSQVKALMNDLMDMQNLVTRYQLELGECKNIIDKQNVIIHRLRCEACG